MTDALSWLSQPVPLSLVIIAAIALMLCALWLLTAPGPGSRGRR